MDERGLVQFWGAKVVSRWDDDTGRWSKWTTVKTPDNFHTVEIMAVEKVTDQKQR